MILTLLIDRLKRCVDYRGVIDTENIVNGVKALYECEVSWVFNGIGTSHANEILHLAYEHPAQKASVIFGNHTRRERFRKAMKEFFSFAHSDKYQKAIPSGRSGGSGSLNLDIWRETLYPCNKRYMAILQPPWKSLKPITNISWARAS